MSVTTPSLRAALLAGSLLVPVTHAVALEPPQAEAARPVVDESALRYYASRNEKDRMEAEIRRLRALYPDWQVPTDLAAGKPTVDREAPLWQLFAKDDMDGLEKAIAALKVSDPGFTPSQDLTEKIAWKKARHVLIEASDRGDHAAVLSAVTTRPDLVGCQDLDATWRVAEAQIRTRVNADGMAIYRRILQECPDPAGRLATIEKTLAILGPGPARELLGLLPLPADGTDPYAKVRPAIARAIVASALAAISPTPEQLEPQTTQSLAVGTGVRVLEGSDKPMATTVDANGNLVETSAPDNTEKTMAPIPGTVIGHGQGMADVPQPTEAEISLLLSSQLPGDPLLVGWWLRASGDRPRALTGFHAAATLGANDAAILAESIEGMARTLWEIQRIEEAYVLARDHRARSRDLLELYIDIGGVRFLGTPRPRLPDAEVADFARSVVEVKSGYGARVLGWYAHDFGAVDVARQWFEAALRFQPDEDAARGLVISLAAAGEEDLANQVLVAWSVPYPGLMELTAEPQVEVAATAVRQPVRVKAEPAAVSPAATSPRTGSRGSDGMFAAYERRDYRGCVSMGQKKGAGLSVEQSLVMGWCLLKLDRPVEAAAAFARAEGAGGRVGHDATYGRSLALMASGAVSEATAVASSRPLAPERRNEIGVAALADQAIALFNAGRYRDCLAVLEERRRHAQETADLSMMRGWAYYHLGNRADALALFQLLDRTQSTRATRAALASLKG